MKVVFATGIFPPDIGGPATSVSTLAEAWGAQGHHVSVVTFSDVGDDGVARPYDVRRIPRAQAAWRRQWSFLKALWRASSAPGPIFAQDGVASGLPALIVAKLRRRRLIVRVAGDFAWERAQVSYGYTDSLEAFQKDLSVPAPVFLARILQRFVYRRADRVIVPSRYLAGVAKAWGVPEGRIRIIYNGVHLPPKQEGAVKRPRRIVAAARLVPWKNIDVLIKAMPKVLRRFPDSTLTIVGDGPEMTRLRALAGAPMLVGKVEFTGRLERGALCRTIAESAVFALPSSYEGFSHQLVEAFACGAAVVASRAGGNPELLEDGKNGLLVEPGDASGLADAIIAFMDDPVFAGVCAAEAGKDLARFSVETQIRETTEAILGDGKLRVLLVSRDGTAADPDSRTADRMRAYGEKIDRLHVVCLSKAPAASVELSDRVHVERVDVRGAWKQPWKIFRAVRDAAIAVDPSVIAAQDPFEAGMPALAAARAVRAPLLVEEHGGVYLSEHWKGESAKNRLLHPLGLRVLRKADGIRAVSEKIEADLKERFPSKRIMRVPVYSEPRACRAAASPDTFGYVGRFVPQKNLPALLWAFRRIAKDLPEARLIMAGGGPLEQELRAQAADTGIAERVTWLPYDEDVDAVYARIGTLVLSSWYEGWARVVPEAMSCGIPVVMTDVGCAREVVRNGIEGYVVPIGDDELLAKAMLEIADKGRHGMMSAAARRRVETLPSQEELIGRVVGSWKEMAGL
jgi:glycosyltransferase involved in cell wall biosynthesis